VSVVVPVYNNASTLAELAARVRASLPDRAVQLVFVDDGSTDQSRMVSSSLGVDVVTHSVTRGQNAAVLTGLSHARQPLACVIDADLEDPPESIPRMLEHLASAEVAFSSREEPRRSTSRVFRWIIQRLFPTLPPHPCLCFAIDQSARMKLIAAARPGDYLPALIGWLRLAATEVAVERTPGTPSLEGRRRARYAASAISSAIRIRFRAR
jgi:glycosyltransferase involved in cell wall biosynthesis